MSDYKIICREEGREPGSTEEFATLEAASKYIQDRWQGPEYMHDRYGFHTDFSEYELVGFSLHDIGTVSWNEYECCREYEFTSKQKEQA